MITEKKEKDKYNNIIFLQVFEYKMKLTMFYIFSLKILLFYKFTYLSVKLIKKKWKKNVINYLLVNDICLIIISLIWQSSIWEIFDIYCTFYPQARYFSCLFVDNTFKTSNYLNIFLYDIMFWWLVNLSSLFQV